MSKWWIMRETHLHSYYFYLILYLTAQGTSFLHSPLHSYTVLEHLYVWHSTSPGIRLDKRHLSGAPGRRVRETPQSSESIGSDVTSSINICTWASEELHNLNSTITLVTYKNNHDVLKVYFSQMFLY